MTDRVADWTALIEAQYPLRHAASWDNAGLQVGSGSDPVSGVLIALDVTEAVLDEAATVGADLLITHHPLLFRPLARLTPDTAAGALALAAARRGIAVYAAHTNFDVAEGGTTSPVVDILGLEAVRPLKGQSDTADEICKLTTFVPSDDTPAVIAALGAAGAGEIGEYAECTFRVPGTGTFRPSAEANPAVGERGERNEVAEDRLEVEVPRSRLAAVIAALWDAHPYEEVAYDVYELLDDRPAGRGLGRIGDLPETITLRTVADRLARELPAPHLRLAGDPAVPVRRVAACGGAGDGLIDDARAAGADVYITGDLRHHPTLDALTAGMALIDAGHYAMEAAALPSLRSTLATDATRSDLEATLYLSALRTEPWAEYRPPGGP